MDEDDLLVVDGTRLCWYGNINRLAVNAAAAADGRLMPGTATVVPGVDRRFGADGYDVMPW